MECAEPFSLLVAPQDLGCPLDKLLINGCRFPIATTMRLQTGGSQNARHCGVMNRINDGLLHHHLGQAPAVPPRQVQTISAGLGASGARDRHPLERGKKPPGAHCARHRRWQPNRVPGSGATSTIKPPDSNRPNARWRQSVRHGLTPTGLGLAERPA